MSDLVLVLSQEMRNRLEALAEKLGHSLEDCGQLAVSEFVERYEDYLATIAALESDEEERPVLRAVND